MFTVRLISRSFAALLNLGLLAALPAAQAQSSATDRVHFAIGSFERSARHDGVELGGSVGAAGVQLTAARNSVNQYPAGRAAYDQAHERTLNQLRQNQGVANNGANLRHNETTTRVGATVFGVGYERQSAPSTRTRSAQEDALHTWDRTAHLRQGVR